MTSESREDSWDQGKPVALYRFTRGAREWFYTSSDRNEVLGEDTYVPASIKRSSIRQGSERAKLNITITLPSTLPVADNWRPYPPLDVIAVTCLVRHVGEADAFVEWVGRVSAPKFNGATLDLTCIPSRAAKSSGQARVWQLGCDLMLFSQGVGMCNLDPAAVAVPGVLETVSGTSVSAAGFAAAPRNLAGGRLEWVAPGGDITQRAILVHDGAALTLDSPAVEFVVGAGVIAYTATLYRQAVLLPFIGLALVAVEFGYFPDGRLAGGYIEWERADGLMEYRTIKSHEGQTIVIDYGAADLAEGLTVTAYPGCNQTWADCSYFENTGNFGGCKDMPVQNPYSGNPVW